MAARNAGLKSAAGGDAGGADGGRLTADGSGFATGADAGGADG
jgi:hypothetical protein